MRFCYSYTPRSFSSEQGRNTRLSKSSERSSECARNKVYLFRLLPLLTFAASFALSAFAVVADAVATVAVTDVQPASGLVCVCRVRACVAATSGKLSFRHKKFHSLSIALREQM